MPKPRGKHPKGSPKVIVQREKDLEALRLRKTGMLYGDIAKQMGMGNRSVAYKAVMRCIDVLITETKEEAREIVELELLRLDDLLTTCWEEAKEGNMQAVDRVLKIMERRERYLGLDAPKKTQITGADGGPVKLDLSSMSLDELEAIARGTGDKSGS